MYLLLFQTHTIYIDLIILYYTDTPGKVKNATTERSPSSSLLITRWSSLPSLDLNDTDPDIVYSVELYKITCGEDIFMSREDVFVNSTNNTVDPMEIYKVIITARNNVEGARIGNGTETSGKAPSIIRILKLIYCMIIYTFLFKFNCNN